MEHVCRARPITYGRHGVFGRARTDTGVAKSAVGSYNPGAATVSHLTSPPASTHLIQSPPALRMSSSSAGTLRRPSGSSCRAGSAAASRSPHEDCPSAA
eukprot:5828452-Prymnesium_polylepis.1